MICKFCATGADVMSRANEIKRDHDTLGVDILLEDMRRIGPELHKYCKGRTSCDCQHKEPIANGS